MLGATTTEHRRTAPTPTSSPPGRPRSAQPPSPWRRRTSFACLSPNLDSLTARRCRRHCSPRSNCMVRLGHGGPTMSLLWEPTDRLRGTNSRMRSALTTSLRGSSAGRRVNSPLKQGSRSVEEYCEEFNRLALYAPEQVDTPAKRKDRFLEGLSAELQDRLNLNMGGTFAEFVNNAIVAEDGYRRVMAERKRSASAMGPSNGPPQKFRMVYTTPSGQRYRSAPVPAPVVRPPQPAQQRPPVPRPQQSQGGFRPPQRPNPQPGSFPCYNCSRPGHFSREYPHPKKEHWSEPVKE
ncbi:hypothetical protein PR202_ga12741 [Eleusine coracana subsp. coracana]|uniref:CCHC-type domain-containing protein n=1 Tax=Eleusine coracana subsp. coracana TaxID=191504 RepID=A0AAV5CCW7_ELECO|nr:hypothetical protein PR202_ga12741 [Eleusine coracana subsp. coracana]